MASGARHPNVTQVTGPGGRKEKWTYRRRSFVVQRAALTHIMQLAIFQRSTQQCTVQSNHGAGTRLGRGIT